MEIKDKGNFWITFLVSLIVLFKFSLKLLILLLSFEYLFLLSFDSLLDSLSFDVDFDSQNFILLKYAFPWYNFSLFNPSGFDIALLFFFFLFFFSLSEFLSLSSDAYLKIDFFLTIKQSSLFFSNISFSI